MKRDVYAASNGQRVERYRCADCGAVIHENNLSASEQEALLEKRAKRHHEVLCPK